MNEEEKEVVELLQHCQNTYIEDTLVTHLQLTTEEAKILLNLVEKQQKEIKRKDKVFDDCKYTIIEYVKTAKDTMQKMEAMIEIEKDVINEFDKLLKGE